MAERNYFGIDARHSFSLPMRLWADLVTKLSTMEMERHSNDDKLFTFKGGGKTFRIRVGYKDSMEGMYRFVEVLDDDGQVLAEDSFFGDGICGSVCYHPLTELFDLVERNQSNESSELKKARALAALLA